MGVYIKCMKLPKCCFECPCYHRKRDVGYYDYELCDVNGTIFNDSYSSVTGHKDKIDPFKEKLGNCPLIEIPSHGRLKDADALKMAWDGVDENMHTPVAVIRALIDDATTIIEAEE